MDLEKMTYMELIDLSSQVKEQIKNISNREKTKAFKICCCGQCEFYLEKQNALNRLKELIEEDENDIYENFFGEDDSNGTTMIYLDSAELKWCKDLKN